ncbi:hypothetical protein GCM10027345_20760 [Hymenobacter daeguensis]
MRNNSEGMVEIIGSQKVAANSYSCEAIIELKREFIKLRFSVTEIGYMMLKKLLSFQPFENISAGIYRYYFSGSYRFLGDDQVFASIRIEQGRRHKQFEIEVTRPIIANLNWLGVIKDKEEVAQLLF